jgi:undecaprenyl-diphosphatase
MTTLDAVLLGLVQGLTEFLPVSSSGHLVLVEHWLSIASPGVTFEVAVHVGTLFSILVMLRSDVLALVQSGFALCKQPGQLRSKYEHPLAGLVLVGILPAGVAGIFFKDFFEGFFGDPSAVGGLLIGTGLFLIGTRWLRKPTGALNWSRALIIGILQIAALLPGVSRSGSTIAGGMYAGVGPAEATRFSFLMAIPLLAGATVLEISDFIATSFTMHTLLTLGAGMLVAFVSGCFAIAWLLRIVAAGRFAAFGYYCCAVGVIALLTIK